MQHAQNADRMNGNHNFTRNRNQSRNNGYFLTSNRVSSMQYPQYEDDLIDTLENDPILPFGAEQQHGGLYNQGHYNMTPSNRRMYNAYAEPQNYFDYDYVDYQNAFLPDVPYASSRAFVPNPMQSFSGYSTQSDTSVSSTNPFNPSQLTSSNHADDEASSPLAAGRYESPDMVYHSDNDYTGAQAPADYARSGLSQHCYKSSHGSFQRDDSDDASYHSHHSHNPQALRLSSSPSHLQPVRASLSPPRRS